MATELRARVLASDDAEAYLALRQAGIAAFPDAFLLTEAEAATVSAERVAPRLAAGWLHGLVEADGRLVGFAGLDGQGFAMTKHRAHIGPVYVVPRLQGTGAADILMDHLEAVAKARGVTQLELWVADSNHRARAYYTKRGFRAQGRIPAATRRAGRDQDDIFMVRDLAAPLPPRGADGLRRLGRGDWRIFRDIRIDALTQAPDAFGSMLSDWSDRPADDVADWLDNVHLWAVVEGGRALATVGWHPFTPPVCRHRGHVIAAYTRPQARGRGHLRDLMASVAEEARGQRIVQLELDVGAENTDARAAYEALGFAVVGGIPRALNHHGRVTNQLYMVLPL